MPAGNSGVVAGLAGLRLPVESRPLQALVSEPLKPCLDTVVMSNAVHGYVSQSDKGDLVIGAGVDGYNGYGQRGSFHVIEHTLQAICELFPAFSRVRMNRQWGGVVDTCPDACPCTARVYTHVRRRYHVAELRWLNRKFDVELLRRSISALYRHRRRHAHCAGRGVPVLKDTPSAMPR